MSALILHHYPMSPFSEKIRLMLGYSGLSWQSVSVRELPPRPELAEMVGGYRKIPVAQIGADLFCDTRIIATEIARLSGKPELALENNDEAVQAFVRVVDLEVFLACLVSASGSKMLGKLIKSTSLLEAMRFLKDRINMGRNARVKALGPKQAKERVQEHLVSLEQMLKQDFLFGDSPNNADFAAFHSLWFVCDLAEKPVTLAFPKVHQWMDRMRAFGHGNQTPISSDDALDIARENEPRPVSRTAEKLMDQSVSIAPNDYGRTPVTGLLVGGDEQRRVINRDTERCGAVHVHLPRQGFSIREH
ncbi:MAG: glutathione S-transferase family protein [Halomonadaceae bacterium]|nr:MAG: glutathione S-transferase family protein [Halomonadaceae bacterium]